MRTLKKIRLSNLKEGYHFHSIVKVHSNILKDTILSITQLSIQVINIFNFSDNL